MGVWNKARGLLRRVGPGFVTGVADDDPSGIATYSIAGAQYGYRMSWMTLFLIPSMVAVQEMCGRIGLVTGEGLAGAIKRHRSRGMMWFAVGLLAVANTINIGADLGIMAASLQMLFGLPYRLWLLLVVIVVVGFEVIVPYKRYSQALKWLGLSLLGLCRDGLPGETGLGRRGAGDPDPPCRPEHGLPDDDGRFHRHDDLAVSLLLAGLRGGGGGDRAEEDRGFQRRTRW